jgi:hypothetical protein
MNYAQIPKDSRFIDMTGRTVYDLSVLGYVGKFNGSAKWHCECACKKRCIVRGSDIRSGNTKSCGCSVAKKSRSVYEEPPSIGPSEALIQLTKGKWAIVDKCDFYRLSRHKWFYSTHGYAMATVRVGGTVKKLSMHRVVLGEIGSLHVDHINRNTVDNRRENLRPATRFQNLSNRPARLGTKGGLKGVTWDKQCQKWKARITSNGKTITLGLFKSKEDAHAAYCEAAPKMHGEFARVA